MARRKTSETPKMSEEIYNYLRDQLTFLEDNKLLSEDDSDKIRYIVDLINDKEWTKEMWNISPSGRKTIASIRKDMGK